jgi:hypothetical protein
MAGRTDNNVEQLFVDHALIVASSLRLLDCGLRFLRKESNLASNRRVEPHSEQELVQTPVVPIRTMEAKEFARRAVPALMRGVKKCKDSATKRNRAVSNASKQQH